MQKVKVTHLGFVLPSQILHWHMWAAPEAIPWYITVWVMADLPSRDGHSAEVSVMDLWLSPPHRPLEEVSGSQRPLLRQTFPKHRIKVRIKTLASTLLHRLGLNKLTLSYLW
ncbi:hypothetical protein GDO81_028520 [Engystomops pustulosus]|uniref:Uncharacterized protein n=1 Tax=Engystomops pustulosus TaxID=76066 RepID=A0AAV6YEH8_ENGPU|nr:hypothetical protein GDO81_028520 [Engystomops pustulosus]